MSIARWTSALLLGLFVSGALAGEGPQGPWADGAHDDLNGHGKGRTRTYYGDRASLGDGTIQTYVRMRRGKPRSVGVRFSESMLDNLPDTPFDGNNCYDVDGDGELNVAVHPFECMGGHQRILFMPPQAKDTPFTWVLLNWNLIGHDPPGVYLYKPHFDFHFYIQDYVARSFIRPGPCALLINCDDLVTATMPIPPQYIHPDYVDVGAAEVRMGNHLVDLTSPEFQPGGEFTHTFIYGAYGGEITFWEPMNTIATLKERPRRLCTPIKQPAEYQVEGYYPTEYCIRYYPRSRSYTVSMDKMVFRHGT